MHNLNTNTIDKKVELFKILGDPSRLQIIMILQNRTGILCVNDIAEQLDITASAVSHQLSKLEEKGIVTSEKNGKNSCYRLTHSTQVKKIQQLLKI